MISITDIEAINLRCSRRSYTDVKIDEVELRKIKNLIDEYNKKEGLSIRFALDGAEAFTGFNSYGMFSGVRSLIILSGKKSIENLKEKLGFYGELLVLEATKLNLGTCFVAGSFNKKKLNILSDEEELVSVITIGNVPEDKAFREKFILSLIHRKSKDLKEFYEAEEKVPDWFINGVKAIQRAPSAANRQPVKLKYDKGDVTAFVEKTDHLQLVDLGIAKANFSLAVGGHFEFGNFGKFVKA